MVGLKLDLSNSNITENTILKYSKKVSDIHKELQEKKSDEKEFLGWLDLPTKYNKKEVKNVQQRFKRIQMCFL